MIQWIMGLNAINSLAKTLMMIGHRKVENNYRKDSRSDFSDILKSEMAAKELSKEKVENIVALYDTNQDGKISVRESGFTVQQFQQWDVNKDGYITAQEIQMLWSHNGPFTSFKD